MSAVRYIQTAHEDAGEEHVETPVEQRADAYSSANNARVEGLRWYDLSCIIIQRMIGTGIFLTPGAVLHVNLNVGLSLMFWLAGGLVTLAATYLYLELASTFPRLAVHKGGAGGTWAMQHMPMNGGELIYLTTFFKRLRFCVACVFGVIFVILGNSAANCIAFALNFIHLVQSPSVTTDPRHWIVMLVALFASVVVCFGQSAWRGWGIRINDGFAILKIGILCTIIILGLNRLRNGHTTHNLDHKTVFQTHGAQAEKARNSVSFGDQGAALLAIVFSYGGWNQANYVLGEARLPLKAFRWTVFCTVLGVVVLYLLVNVIFMAVVPPPPDGWGSPIVDGNYIMTEFLKSSTPLTAESAASLVHATLAVSSFGNIIVTTFTAARVKQEVAKEGVFFYEYSINVVRSWDLNPRHWLDYLARRWLQSQVKTPNSTMTMENPAVSAHLVSRQGPHIASYGLFASTPTPALILHCLFSSVMIFVSVALPSETAYTVYLGMYTLLIDVCIPGVLALNILLLGLPQPPARFTPLLRMFLIRCCAVIVFLADAFVFGLMWVPHQKHAADEADWEVVPATATIITALGFAYWLCLVGYRKFRKTGEVFLIDRKPRSEYLEECQRDVLVSEWLEQKWLSLASGTGPEVYLKTLKKREWSAPNNDGGILQDNATTSQEDNH